MTIYQYKKPPSIKYRLARKAINLLQDPNQINQGLDDGIFPGQSYNINKSPLKNKVEKNQKVDDFDVFYIKSKKAKSKTILYLHGGAYINGIFKAHFSFIKHLTQAIPVNVVIPDYPLTPKYDYLKTYAVVEQVYDELLQQTDASQIIFMGDSAGAGLALGLYLKLQNQGKPLPKDLILISPWLDVNLQNDEIYQYLKTEPLLKDLLGLQRAGRIYAKGDTTNELISPILGHFNTSPHLHIFIGTNDIFHPDCKKIHALQNDKNIHVDLYEYNQMMHCWALEQTFKESKHALKQIVKIIKKIDKK